MDMGLIVILSLFTFGAVILIALRSKSMTEEKLHDPNSKQSSLARSRPDPKFKPDRRVTNPENVARN
ncbi:hypothetical protein R5H30_09415 [Sulfitobacter sp. D35]|uniref:hypothetical protein n=1 Tax=Sulfitobacter sp. D35 TaxID=3083252 RepID=UPI00296FDA14|nr:hypothetical protein [Sulfitobacter sp. D35]MDW4498196.1 hypothetical protein [Sulfitobacter sp. D35]